MPNTNPLKSDIVIKDEGSFKSVFFNSAKIKKWAKKNDLRNDSMNPKENWKVDVKKSHAKLLIKEIKKEFPNLTVFDF